MKTFLGPIVAVLITCGFASTSWATVYNVNDSVGVGGSVTGSIQTDGNTGTLTLADITNWNLVLNDGSRTFTLSSPPNANNADLLVGTSLTATASGLFFDFSTHNGSFVEFKNPATGSALNYLCLQDASGACSSNPSDFVIRVDPDSLIFASESGKVEIATAVPEPASVALLLAGLAGLGFLRRRKVIPPST
jgi:hypothetical protein